MTNARALRWIAVGIVLVFAAPILLAAEGALKTGSRAPYVHRISLYDTDGEVISPKDDPIPPFSAVATCGKCHDYGAVGSGRHFNAADPDADPGRPAEPWILTDLKTGTQIPVSSRKWPGAYKPADVGLTPWTFVQTFGSHFPGGGLGDRFAEKAKDPKARWAISGKLEIGCMNCHSSDPRHDLPEWGKQIEEQNFKWIHIATTGIGTVRGSAKKLPDTFDPLLDADPAAATAGKGPTVAYDAARFDADERVLFQIPPKPPAERCIFCHFARPAEQEAEEMWKADQDVHLAAGLTCADCHRNGLNHQIERGIDEKSTLSCQGCHESGRLGAPALRHLGLPASHLEKLTCTACHSGARPTEQARNVRTARAHGLGVPSTHRRDDVPPFIVEPVLLKLGNGKIAPHRMIWPAFWAYMKGDALSIIPPDAVAQVAGDTLGGKQFKEEDWKPLTEEQVSKALEALAAKSGENGEPVYVAGGKIHKRTKDGKLTSSDHAAATPYAWPFAHDVRPAAQALGANYACTDCHAKEAGFFHGSVAAASPAQIGPPTAKPMYELQGYDSSDVKAWERTARYRNLWIVVGLVAVSVLGLVLGNAVVMSLGAILRGIFVRKPRRVG
ncbi:MAG: cytochrome c3 family protein [Planctomycetota bacterium]